MGDLFAVGEAFLARQQGRYLSQLVTYERGSDSVELAATVGRSEFDQTDEYGVLHRYETRDYIIRAADLILNGQRVLPQAGDRVHESVEGQTFIYEVMSPLDGPPWRWADNYRLKLRVYTKQVA